jgi:putative dehydrogenase
MAANKLPVGVIGLGVMGSAMSGNLVKAGFQVVGYDVRPGQVQILVGKGGTAAASAKEVAERCELIVTSLPSPQALHDTVSGTNGLLAAKRKGIVVSECSTLTLEDKLKTHAALAAGGILLLDSPLSGTGAQAVTGDLLVYCSGDKGGHERMLPVYQAISRGNHFLGEFGNGSKIKYIANLLVAIHNVAAAEGMVLAMKAGLDPAQALKALTAGAGTSRMLEVRGQSMVDSDYSNGAMRMDLWTKDMHIIGEFATALRCPVPLFSQSAQIYAAGLAQGHISEDTAVVCTVMEQMAGVKR